MALRRTRCLLPLRESDRPRQTQARPHRLAGACAPIRVRRDNGIHLGAFRWLNGTPVIPALYAAAEGPKILRRAGVGAIREKSVRLTSHLIDLADARGYTVHAPRDSARRGGTVAIDVPHGYEVTQHLLSRNILVDYRVGAGIRISPHCFTKQDELDEAVSEIDKALESG